MRFLVFSALFLSLCVPSLVFGETIKHKDIQPLSAELIGQGNAYVSAAEGYYSVFTNPAGIARTRKPEITLSAISLWVHSKPSLLLGTIGALGGGPTDNSLSGDASNRRNQQIVNTLKEQFVTNGFGLGMSYGLGYVGNGFAAVLSTVVDSYAYGDTFPFGIEGEVNGQLTLALGYAHSFYFQDLEVSVGTTIRPLVRVAGLLNSDSITSILVEFFDLNTGTEEQGGLRGILENIYALNGVGVGFDTGVLLDYRTILLGIQFRNMFNTYLNYSNNTAQELFDELLNGGLPKSTDDEESRNYVADTYILPMDITFGLGWKPNLGFISQWVSTELHMQYTDPFALTDNNKDDIRSVWTRLHTGASVTFFQVFHLRFGINQGYLTSGVGITFPVLEIHFAAYYQEYGTQVGDQPVGGSALDIVFRL